ncbi:hypothetical protein [Bacillus cereus]|uniref:hypothetical protein n=1 Tax=Bacillus cereus TaxID=1396 RepID=UPI000BF99F11|nr:hypothetical protein [Bacillus cereus]PFI17578.1 hypothetical protein COI75_19750 [Bacillus cereus]
MLENVKLKKKLECLSNLPKENQELRGIVNAFERIDKQKLESAIPVLNAMEDNKAPQKRREAMNDERIQN